MLKFSKIQLSYCYCRFIATSSMTSKNYMGRQGKFMRKLMREDAPKKKWHTTRPGRTQQAFSVDTSKLVSPHVTRRVNVLNKIFMNYITDMMTTGEMSTKLVGRSIEVTHVKLSNDFHVVRVYWFCNEHDPDRLKETNRILEQMAFNLRHELSQLKVIGVVPQIQFVKDKAVAANIELEKRIADADYGEDHVPIVRVAQPKPQLTLYTTLPADVKKKLLEEAPKEGNEEAGSEEDPEDNTPYLIDLPPMKHNILGLNHWIIMSRVKQSLNKVRTPVTMERQWSPVNYQQSFDPVNVRAYQNTAEEMKAFDEFLIKRKIEDKYRDRWELRKMNSDVFNNENETDEYDESYDYEEEQYIDEFNDPDSQKTVQ
ncbi:uncharacterized protein [Fopius arisanus]|uniref:RBFA protein n=1 Tax=Fopius arisanus TaxID=64838 RepID=A0A0C9REP4_9HYME|nr:PREDICTED: uncharacterized protein LOC105273119 [Fopius arisanus]